MKLEVTTVLEDGKTLSKELRVVWPDREEPKYSHSFTFSDTGELTLHSSTGQCVCGLTINDLKEAIRLIESEVRSV